MLYLLMGWVSGCVILNWAVVEDCLGHSYVSSARGQDDYRSHNCRTAPYKRPDIPLPTYQMSSIRRQLIAKKTSRQDP